MKIQPHRLHLMLAIASLAVILGSRSAYSQSTDTATEASEPAGRFVSGTFADSKVYPGTTREYSVYIPKQYDPQKPANLMVFMDGKNYANLKGPFRVPAVLDTLIQRQEMPVTIGVFVNPGTIQPTRPGATARSNRSFEDDAVGDRYARFLIDEFLPVALKDLNVSDSAKDRAVCGISSGGICAFTVAWERPDSFGKVLSHIGSFTNIRGGWEYPGLVRQTKDNPKPIKVYLQEGVDDLDNLHGNWPLGNHDLAAALQFAGYPFKLVMTEGGHSGKWAGEALPDALRWLWNEQSESTVFPQTQTKPAWEPPADAIARQDVPHGTVESMPPWESTVFPNTIRDWAIYVPAQYQADQPAALMVFQDGERMRDVKGRWRVPTVLDNLIAEGAMPPTIAVFINPGHDKSKPRQGNKSSNRGYEYDSLGGRYAQFLLTEILPEVRARYNVSTDPAMRAIGGSSSGAICAFTVAWEHPEAFGKVYSNVGSFTNLRGGNVYPALVRKTEPKPIRVYMADTSGDVDNAFGSWPWANRRMAAALQYMGYDVRFDWAEGYAHNADFGSSKFPEAMRWLWRKDTHSPVIDTRGDLGGDLTLLNLLIPGRTWEVVAADLGFADAPCCDSEGTFYVCDMKAPAIYRIDDNGQRTVIAKEAVSGMKLAPDGLFYACQGAKKRVISVHPMSGEIKVIAEDVVPNDLAIADDGTIYITQTRQQEVTRIDPKTGATTTVDSGIERPNGIAISDHGGTLAVSDHGGPFSWLFRINADGSLDAKMPTMPMRLPIDEKGEFKFNQPPPYVAASRGDGMAVDRRGRYYVTSALGVQVFDPTGRPCGVLPAPDPSQPLTSCTLAGSQRDWLYITNGKTVFRRALKID
ncbi:MAG: alpha/beta hydrolase-fold protein [Pirellulaceae bacterium]